MHIEAARQERQRTRVAQCETFGPPQLVDLPASISRARLVDTRSQLYQKGSKGIRQYDRMEGLSEACVRAGYPSLTTRTAWTIVLSNNWQTIEKSKGGQREREILERKGCLTLLKILHAKGGRSIRDKHAACQGPNLAIAIYVSG